MNGTLIERADVQRALDDYAAAWGRDEALTVLEETTGTRDLEAVPQHRFIVAGAALIGALTLGRRPTTLDAIRNRVFAKMRGSAVKIDNKLASLDAIRNQAFAKMRGTPAP
jgi:hypothetical protein